MKRYRDTESGIAGYEVGKNYIRVRFREGSIYRYTYRSTGMTHIERMKQLAAAGVGLMAYINQYVRGAYALREQ